MNILIAQPKLEKEIKQLEYEMQNNPSADIIIFPEGYLNTNIDLASALARKYEKIIISGYKSPKDRAVIINRSGKVVLDRAKYDKSTLVEEEGVHMGHMLCDELILQGMSDMDPTRIPIHFIAHPIGVGMFSEDQFHEWIDVAKKIAMKYNSLVIGTSHADGSYRDSDVSIPIAYCINENGEEVFQSMNDVRTRILNTRTRMVTTIENKI